jgi:transmembrane sensor
MNRQDYIELYKKFLSGECTPDELELLNNYTGDLDFENIPWDAEIGDEEDVEQRIFNKITEKAEKPQVIRRIIIKRIAIAASFLLFACCTGLYYLASRPKKEQIVRNKVNPVINDILPGGNKAILTLANGSKIILNNAKDGILTRQGNAAVSKTQNGKLVYSANDRQNDPSSSIIVYNTVSTPRGGEYQIVLSDGTKVWLNAASSLKFPTAFKGTTRDVEITGEVYFEVAKNKNMPFKVFSNGVEVEVLGTHFDVMAYQDEPEIKTTLLEGAVKFKPGQQAIVSNNSNSIAVKQANIGETMAWREGYFVFQDENIQSIMRKVSRWYNVDVRYQGNMEDKEYGGKISRYKNISDVLKSLELTGTIRFKVEERRVTVTL